MHPAQLQYIDVTFTLDAGVAYATGDVLADTQPVNDALTRIGGHGVLHSVYLLDKDDQAQALDLVFLQENVSLGTENGQVSITDANAEKILGVIEIGTTDYVDLINSQCASINANAADLALRAKDGSRKIYLGAISRGTGTYTANGIFVRLAIIAE